MNWMDSPPALDRAFFSSNLTELDSFLADKLAESFFSSDHVEHKVSVVELKACVLQGRSLEAAINLTPEISAALCEGPLRMKTALIVDPAMDYEIPRREGNLRVNTRNRPHIYILSGHEIDQFRAYGTARLLIVIGGSGGMPGLMNVVSRGLKSGRIERLLIVTDQPTSARDRRANYHMFIRNNITVNYSSISQENLL